MKALFIQTALLLFCGCAASSSGPVGLPSHPVVSATSSPTEFGRAFEEAKGKWRDYQIHNYDMTLSLETTSFLEPARAVNVRVREGKTFSIEVADPSDKKGRLAFYDPYTTVEKMFARIEGLLLKPGSLTVKYNSDQGYPEEIEYSEPVPDTSFRLRVLNFRPVAIPPEP